MKGNALMRRSILAALALLIASTAVDARPKLFSSHPRELPKVASSISIATKLTTGDTTSDDHDTSDITNAFTTTNGSPTVTVTHTAHGRSVNDRVIFSFLSSRNIGGLDLQNGYRIQTVPDANTYTITHASNATSDAGPTGNTTVSYRALTTLLDGKMRFFCNFSHLAYDDPILKPQQSGQAHLHLFFGNASTNAHSTYESLRRNAAGSTCDGDDLNATAYWMPAMIDSLNSVVRIPEYFEWYYQLGQRDMIDYSSLGCPGSPPTLQGADGRPAACPNYALKRMERGARAIFGFNPSTGDYPTSYKIPAASGFDTQWKCQNTSGVQQGAGYQYMHHRTSSSLGLTSNGSCPATGKLVVRVTSPKCWSGSYGATPADIWDQWATNGNDGNGSGGGGNNICPSSHPYTFPQFLVIASWPYTGGIATIADWYLSSDRHNGSDYEAGESFHWDMMWAWDDDVLDHVFKYVMGMVQLAEPVLSTPRAPAYIHSDSGSGDNVGTNCSYNAAHPTANGSCFYVGAPYMRNTNNGGLGAECAPLGMSGGCHLSATSNGIFDTTLPIPTPP
jgi:hypothetical protein